MTELRVLVDGLSFLEGPRWHGDTGGGGRIWFSDFYTDRVFSAGEDGSDLRVEAEVPGQPSGLGWLPDGRLLVVSMRERTVLRREPDGTLSVHADLSAHVDSVLNDMVVAEDGTAWVGSFGFDLMSGAPRRSAPLLRVDPDGSVSVATEPLHFPNGPTIVDSGTLVVAESLGNRLSAFDIGPGGELSDRRDWAAFGPVPEGDDAAAALGQVSVAPDGISGVDAEGAIWAADALAHRAVRVRPGGEIAEQVSTGDVGCYACALGGADGRTLFLCTAPSFFEHERRDTLDARMLATRVDVPAAG